MSSSAPVYFTYLIASIPSILVLIGCIIFMSRSAGTASVLLLIGQILSILTLITNGIVISMQHSLAMSMTRMTSVFTLIRVIGFVGGILFAIGFIMVALRQDKTEKEGVYY